MYKNAEKVLNDKEGISKSQVRNAVAKARIELNVRKISTMIHLIQPPSHDEVILPKNKNSGKWCCFFRFCLDCYSYTRQTQFFLLNPCTRLLLFITHSSVSFHSYYLITTPFSLLLPSFLFISKVVKMTVHWMVRKCRSCAVRSRK